MGGSCTCSAVTTDIVVGGTVAERKRFRSYCGARSGHLRANPLQCAGDVRGPPCRLRHRLASGLAARIEPGNDLRPDSRMRLATDQDAQMLHANPDFTLIFNDTRIPVFALNLERLFRRLDGAGHRRALVGAFGIGARLKENARAYLVIDEAHRAPSASAARAPWWCRARLRPTNGSKPAEAPLVQRRWTRPVYYLTICGSLASCGARAPCTRSSSSASVRNSFSRRKCCSRDSGDRHIPARRWCSIAIARYSVALTMVSSHASSIRPAGAGANSVGR